MRTPPALQLHERLSEAMIRALTCDLAEQNGLDLMTRSRRSDAPAGRERTSKRRDYELLLQAAASLTALGEKLGKLTLRNVTTVFALSALVFYVVGLVRRIAQLHAVGVPTTRGVPLAPLQDYLISGLAVVINPYNLYTVLFVTAVAALLLIAPRLAAVISEFLQFLEGKLHHAPDARSGATDPASAESRGHTAIDPAGESNQFKVSPRVERVLSILIWFVVIGFPLAVVALVPVGEWVPFAVLLAVLAILFLLSRRYGGPRLSRPSSWSRSDARMVAGALVTTLLILALLVVWFTPPALDRVRIRPVQGRVVEGPLLAQTNGVVYVAGRRSGPLREADVIALPLGRIASMRISEGTSTNWETVPELLGLRFWRAVQDSRGKWHVQRSPP